MRKLCIACLLALLISFSGCQGAQTQTEQETLDQPVTLTLACWVSDLEVQKLVEDFNEAHTDYQIEILSYYDMDDPFQDTEAAMDRMNIALATGDQPDIFYLDSMDVMKLVNAGLLADLYPYMEQDEEFIEDDYYMNIWELFSQGGKLYEFVPNFLLGCIAGPESLLGDQEPWTIESYLEFSEQTGETLYVSQSSMLAYMIQFAMDDYIDVEEGICNFTDESFLDWMALIASFSEQRSGSGELLPVWLGGVEEYGSLALQFGEAPIFMGYPSTTAGSPTAAAVTSFAISSNSQYGDVCWEFLKSLLTAENQASLFSGFPIRRSVLQTQLAQAQLATDQEDSLFYGYTSTGTPMTLVTAENAEAIETMLESITRVRFRYQAVYDIIEEDMAAYLAGDRSAEATAELIQSRVQLYLDERS